MKSKAGFNPPKLFTHFPPFSVLPRLSATQLHSQTRGWLLHTDRTSLIQIRMFIQISNIIRRKVIPTKVFAIWKFFCGLHSLFVINNIFLIEIGLLKIIGVQNQLSITFSTALIRLKILFFKSHPTHTSF